MVNPVQSILLKHPKDAFIDQQKIDTQFAQLNYLDHPNFEKACNDYDKFLTLIKSFSPEIHFLPKNKFTSLDSIYTHDPCIVSNNGIIICNMGKKERSYEPEAVKNYFQSIGVPILGQIEDPGKLEGGLVEDVITVPLPHWNGPNDCLHLMSNISPIDHDLFLVYSRLLPVQFRKYLLRRKIELIEVPDKEYNSMGCNVLAMANKKVIMMKMFNIASFFLYKCY